MQILKCRRQWRLSSQISLTYALILAATLVVTNLGMTAGVYYLFHHQAARAIELSVEHTVKKAAELGAIDENFFNSGAIMPSVILRVTDNTGAVIVDSSPYFPATGQMLAHVVDNPPIWASGDFEFIETPHSYFYYKNLPLEVAGKNLQFHFFKTITFEKQFVRYLMLTLFAVDLAGMALAVLAGHVLGRKILLPLRKVTRTAREISAGNLNRRLQIEMSGAEVNELAETFNTMLERLEESFVRQQRFIADASHELRTPITIIRGYAEMLESYGATDAELVDEAAREIKNSSRNMQYLVENLLFLARADQGTQPLNMAPVEIASVLAAAVDSFNSPRIEFAAAGTFEAAGDAGFLKKMFAAFLDNALIYSKGLVRVSMEIRGDSAVVQIEDHGIGIAPENLGRIFDRFFRADKSRTHAYGEKISAGLGLSIAKWIADRHGIEIAVDSELERGTIFTLTIPRE